MNSQHKFHNPHKLTPEQVGEGYRLLLESEIVDREPSTNIQGWSYRAQKWLASGRWSGNDKKATYRVPLATWPLPEEPWTLGDSVNGFTLGEGQQWHRLDWTREMLPDGCRPLLMTESHELGDQYNYRGKWCDCPRGCTSPAAIYSTHYRTRRSIPTPEIPWIEWKGGMVCPLTEPDEVEVLEVKFRNGQTYIESRDGSLSFEWFNDGGEFDIVAYRVLKWKITTPALAKYVEPLPPVETFLPGNGGAWLGHPRSDDHAPTDNDAWESLLHTNATLGREVSRLRAEFEGLTIKLNKIREVLE